VFFVEARNKKLINRILAPIGDKMANTRDSRYLSIKLRRDNNIFRKLRRDNNIFRKLRRDNNIFRRTNRPGTFTVT